MSRRAWKGWPSTWVASEASSVTGSRRARVAAGIPGGSSGAREPAATEPASSTTVAAASALAQTRGSERTTARLSHRNRLTPGGGLRTLGPLGRPSGPRAAGAAMFYMYAVVEGLPPAWRPPPAVVPGASVDRRRLGPLLLLGSALDAVPPANPKTLALHHDVVASALDAHAVLPFRYGTTVAADEADT